MVPAAIRPPTLTYDLGQIASNCTRVAAACDEAGCRLLYAAKASTFFDLLACVRPHVAGISVSSAFEGNLVHALPGPDTPIHLTSPGLCLNDLETLAAPASYLSFNSTSQLRRLAPHLEAVTRTGLRVNPARSFVDDPRYDPARPHSKLGASLDETAALLAGHDGARPPVSGLMMHNNCDSTDFGSLLDTAKIIATRFGNFVPCLEWINLGGGYIFPDEGCPGELREAVALLRSCGELDIFVEPGASLVRDGVELAASVVDVFDSGGKTVAVLNTTVNHMPEVFEYQYEPDVRGHRDGARFAYLLAGATCLAGDIFGDYEFDDPLEIGDRITFPDMGAYTLVKAHWFNGINLPEIRIKGDAEPRHVFTFDDYARQNGLRLGKTEYAITGARV